MGPGTGALTKFIVENKSFKTTVIEVDRESVIYLNANFHGLEVLEEDFLHLDFSRFNSEKLAVVGNFPYNISSQIFFKILEEKDRVTEVVGMLQKEVAERIAEPPGTKRYGIFKRAAPSIFTILNTYLQ